MNRKDSPLRAVFFYAILKAEGGDSMNKLSFNQQMILCIVLMFIGFALGTVTEIGWFHNAALMLCGLIWVIHPVPPHLRELQPTAQWEVRIGGIILIIGSLLVRFGA